MKITMNEYEAVMSKAADRMSQQDDEIAALKAQNARLLSALKFLVSATVQIPVDRRVKWANEISENARQAVDQANDAIASAEKEGKQ